MSELRDRTGRDRASKKRMNRRRTLVISLFVGVIVVLGLGLLAGKLISSALTAKDSVSGALGRTETLTAAVSAGDFATADTELAAMESDLGSASAEVDGWAWKTVDWIPIVGANIEAVRVAASTGHSLIADLARPAVPLVMSGLKPTAGAFDLDALRQLADLVKVAGPTVEGHLDDLKEIDRSELLGPVSDGITQLDTLMKTVEPVLADGGQILNILPATLGGDGPREYLLMFQGNSEARSLGGNPAVFIQVRAENGVISISGYADSSDFHNDRVKPIIDLDPEAEAIYGDKIGRWSPDITMPPDFPYAVELARAFWAESVGTQVDGVLSVDPVALSYLLAATGPIDLATGDTLTAENAVALLLNEVYFRYEDPLAQNAFFAQASGGVFTALTNGQGSPLELLSALQRAAGEGRLLYAPTDPAEAALIDGTRVSGSMPTGNVEETVIGVYANDNTGSKKSYYLDMSLDVTSSRCQEGADVSYEGSVTLRSALTEEEAANLPYYIAGPYFAPEEISTFIVLYGPVGGTLDEVLLDGAPATVLSEGTHLGRPAVKVEVLNTPLSEHTIDFTFSLTDLPSGPLTVWHTPMTRETPLAITEPGC